MSTVLPVCIHKLPVVVDGLEAYIQKVNSVPLLTAEEEKALALRYRQDGDLMAAQQLVLTHLRYVVRIARGYGGYGLALSDLIQEGTIGLMKAVKRFDPDLGVRLVSFAVHWVKSEIHDFVIRNWRIVKVATTKAQRKLFFNLRGAKKRLGWFSTAEVQELAQDLGVTTQDVLEMESRLNAHDDSFDPLCAEEDELSEYAPVNTLAGPVEYNPEASAMNNCFEMDSQDKLAQALQALDPRSLDIVSNRWLSDSKAPLKELAEKYNVSIEHIRQLEKAAMQKLRENITNLEWVA